MKISVSLSSPFIEPEKKKQKAENREIEKQLKKFFFFLTLNSSSFQSFIRSLS